MRYFKYKNANKNYNMALKEQYKSLTADEQRTFRREKFWRKFSLIASCVIFFSSVTTGFLLLKFFPQPLRVIWQILASVGKTILGIAILIAGGMLTAGLTKPLWKKADSFHLPSMKKEIIAKACSHLRIYYGLTEPYIITKCFHASDPKFSNHDVCIFVQGDELRITADLVHGFLHGERDLGCYAFQKQEIMLTKQEMNGHLALELKAENTMFLLGYAAKSFIEKNFISEI